MNNQYPYIGVTGITSLEEAQKLHDRYRRAFDRNVVDPAKWPSLMTGVLVSKTTLDGKLTTFPQLYPLVKNLGTIFTLPPGSDYKPLNLIHYCAFSPPPIQDIQRTISLTGPLLTGFQFNTSWPEPEILASVIHSYGNLFPYVCLQVDRQRLDGMKWQPHNLLRILQPYIDGDYGRLIDAVLLDPSGGRGILLEAEPLANMIPPLMKFDLDIGVGGGLSAETMEVVQPLLGVCPYISIDAQARLTGPDGKLDFQKIDTYFDAALSQLHSGV